ncbi:MAG: UPF0175 family protein [Phycisphaerae bacterium]|nr:UPF0175 family protein [Tepidisphaeraceae bacterium]
MPLVIPDDVLEQVGLSEREALVEFACRMFDGGLLPKPAATRLLGINREAFDEELRKRNLPVIRIDDEYWAQEVASLNGLRDAREGGQ